MEFNWTKGKSAKYLVSVRRWGVTDQFYFHYLAEAKETFKKLKSLDHPADTTISIYDITKDAHRDFVRL